MIYDIHGCTPRNASLLSFGSLLLFSSKIPALGAFWNNHQPENHQRGQ